MIFTVQRRVNRELGFGLCWSRLGCYFGCVMALKNQKPGEAYTLWWGIN